MWILWIGLILHTCPCYRIITCEENANEESIVALMELFILPPFPFINTLVLLIIYIATLVMHCSQYCSLFQKAGDLVSTLISMSSRKSKKPGLEFSTHIFVSTRFLHL